MDMRKAFPSRFLKTIDLDRQDKHVIIHSVAMEQIGAKSAPVMYFRGEEKGLVINKTNNNTLMQMFGPDTDAWREKAIILYPSTVEMRGEIVACIRIRNLNDDTPHAQRPAPPAPIRSLREELDDDVPF